MKKIDVRADDKQKLNFPLSYLLFFSTVDTPINGRSN